MAVVKPDFQLFSSLRFDRRLFQSSANSALCSFSCPFYMLPHHRDRILEAATYFQWTRAAERFAGSSGLRHLLQKLETVIDIKTSPPLRVRVIVDHDGEITIDTNEVPSVPLENLFPSRIPIPVRRMNVSSLTGGTLVLGPEDLVKSGGHGHGDPSQSTHWIIVVDSKQIKSSPFTTYKTTCRDMYVAARNRLGIDSMTESREVLIVNETGNEIMEGSLTSVFFWRNGRWVTPPATSGGQIGTTRRWLLDNGLCEEEVVTRDSLVNGEECWISNGVRGLICGRINL